MKNEKIKCIETFKYKKFSFNFSKMSFSLFQFLSFVSHFILQSPSFHINFLTNHMSRDIYRVAYQYLSSFIVW
jgi:hypothetical protein